MSSDVVIRYALGEAYQLTIGTYDDHAKPIVRESGQGLAPLALAKGEGGAWPAVCLNKSGHVELSQGQHVDGGGSAKPKVTGGHG